MQLEPLAQTVREDLLDRQVAEQALKLIGTLYDIEREIKELSPDERLRIRRLRARPAADLLHAWLMAHREKLPDGCATARRWITASSTGPRSRATLTTAN